VRCIFGVSGGLLRLGCRVEVVLLWWGRGVGKSRRFGRAVVVVNSQAICAFLFVCSLGWVR